MGYRVDMYDFSDFNSYHDSKYVLFSYSIFINYSNLFFFSFFFFFEEKEIMTMWTEDKEMKI